MGKNIYENESRIVDPSLVAREVKNILPGMIHTVWKNQSGPITFVTKYLERDSKKGV